MAKQSFTPVDPRPNFPEMESKMLKHWYSSGLIKKYLNKNKTSKKRFSFLDGPITANNPMGVHHAWGRTYKDLYQRYNNMKGYAQRFQNGFDAQGLWVEVEVEKELGFKTKKDIEKYGIAKFVQKCKDRVKKYAAIQTDQSKRLGYFMDWDNSYYTMSDENNYMIWHVLKICHENGWLYKGNDSVAWCPRCETAISQHEILTEDYNEVIHESIYLELPVQGRKNEYLLVWTTTPWTIPANIAVTVDKKLDYTLIEGMSGDRFWIAKDAFNRVFGKDYKKIIKTVKGKALVGLKYNGPFDHLPAVAKVAKENPKTFHIVIPTDPQILPIGTEEGTGLVHTAVSAGTEDFKLGKKHDLPMIPVIADNADYLDGLGFLSGKNAKTHPRLILDYLEKQDDKGENWVFLIENYKHRYPRCWRCKEELVWKVTDEWYIAMDKQSVKDKRNETLRARMKSVAKKIHWMPSFGLERELDWLSNMHDWLISKKNRYWGLALPIWECKSCGHYDVIGSREELRERAIKGWDTFDGKSPHKPQIDAVEIACQKCENNAQRIESVGNVWLDAGIVPYSTITKDNKGKPLYLVNKNEWKKWFPPDFITESFPGQFKNWFYSMIATSAILENTNPYKTVLGFGTLLAEDGRPMHKSWGNAIDFDTGADKIGVDVMRWMYVRQKPERNMLFGYHKADESRREFHLLFWNIYRYFVTQANLNNWKPKAQTNSRYTIIDLWIIMRLEQTGANVIKYLDVFDAFNASSEIHDFVQDLSTWYIRRSRERFAAGDTNALSVLHHCLSELCKIAAPIIPFITEEIYRNLTGNESVHLADYPVYRQTANIKHQTVLLNNMKTVREICSLGNAQRKEHQISVRQPLANVTIYGFETLSQEYEQLIKDELNVKSVLWKQSSRKQSVRLDTNITPDLKAEGDARNLIRKIQNLRKEKGLKLDDQIIIYAPDWPKKFEEEIKKKTLSVEIVKSDTLSISITSSDN